LNNALSRMPEGRQGRILALGLLLLTLCIAWLALAAPLLGWYSAREEQLTERHLMVAHMAQIAATLPALRQDTRKAEPGARPPATLLSGETDAIAGAGLQSVVQDMASTAGVTLTSAEALPGEQQGAFRRIALRVTLRGDWPVLMGMLQAVEESPLRLLVDELQLHATAQSQHSGPDRIEASFVVLGFRPGRESRPNGAAGDLRADAGVAG
jgi:general secretion pathway protein M